MTVIVKKIIKALNLIIVAFFVIFALAVITMKLTNVQAFTILSGSMEPEYSVGALILVKETTPDELDVGDVITYKLGGSTIVTHRIYEIVPDENNADGVCYRMKGDANDVVDASLVAPSQIIGKPILNVDKLGYAADYLTSSRGRPILVGVGLALILFVFITDSFIKDSENESKSKAKLKDDDESDKNIKGE